MKRNTVVTVCKRFEFAYAHNLPQYNGKCRQLHGHTGIVEIEVADLKNGTFYPGMTADFYDITKNVQPIIDMLDHKNLTEVINPPSGFSDLLRDYHPEIQTVVDDDGNHIIPPTSENLVLWLRMMLTRMWSDAEVVRIRFWESPSSYAEWRK